MKNYILTIIVFSITISSCTSHYVDKSYKKKNFQDMRLSYMPIDKSEIRITDDLREMLSNQIDDFESYICDSLSTILSGILAERSINITFAAPETANLQPLSEINNTEKQGVIFEINKKEETLSFEIYSDSVFTTTGMDFILIIQNMRFNKQISYNVTMNLNGTMQPSAQIIQTTDFKYLIYDVSEEKYVSCGNYSCEDGLYPDNIRYWALNIIYNIFEKTPFKLKYWVLKKDGNLIEKYRDKSYALQDMRTMESGDLDYMFKYKGYTLELRK